MSYKAKTIAEILFALSNPARLTIIKRLSVVEKFGGHSITELVEGTGLARQSITKHLDALAEVELVQRLKLGRATLYELKTEPISTVVEWLESIPKDWERTQKKLKSFLDDFQSKF